MEFIKYKKVIHTKCYIPIVIGDNTTIMVRCVQKHKIDLKSNSDIIPTRYVGYRDYMTRVSYDSGIGMWDLSACTKRIIKEIDDVKYSIEVMSKVFVTNKMICRQFKIASFLNKAPKYGLKLWKNYLKQKNPNLND